VEVVEIVDDQIVEIEIVEVVDDDITQMVNYLFIIATFPTKDM